jgi:O-antigen/teichoic acid export membrane protein
MNLGERLLHFVHLLIASPGSHHAGGPTGRPTAPAPSVAGVRKFGFDVGWVLVLDLGAMALAFLVQPVLARVLGADGLGLYTLSVTVMGLALLVGNLGLAHALTRYVAASPSTDDARVHITLGLLLSAAMGTIVGALLYFGRTAVATVFGLPQLLPLLAAVVIAFPFASLFVSIQGALNGQRRMRDFAVLGLLHRVLNAVFVLSLLAAGFGMNGAIWGLVLTEIVCTFIGLLTLRHGLTRALKEIRRRAANLASFGARMSATNAANAILNYTDVVMVGYYMTASDVGYYGVSMLLASLVSKLPGAVQRVTFPAAARCWGTGDLAALQAMTWKSMQVSACVVTLTGLGLAFFAPDLILALFGSTFSPALAPFFVLLAARVVRGATVVPVGHVLPAVGRPDVNFKIEAAAAMLNIPLNMILIPRVGLVGAAIATAASLLVTGAVALVFLVRVAHIRLNLGWYARLTGATVLIMATYLLARTVVNHWALGLGLLATATLIIWFGLLSHDDRDVVKSVLRSVVVRRSEGCQG